METTSRPFHKILVPVDFSEHSQLAVQTAADFSHDYLAPMTLVHVYLPEAYALPGGFVFMSEHQVDRAFEELQKYLAAQKRAAEDAGALEVRTRVMTGAPAGEVCELAEDEEFDLIVMGTHGRSGLSHLLLGSTAERVVRYAPCPVLTVHAHPKPQPEGSDLAKVAGF
jgi:nucleotide-binding universal stress UspA family protein